MTTTNQLLGRSAAPYVLEHEGKQYRFRAMGQVEKSAFRAWLLARVRESLVIVYRGAELDRELHKLTRDAVAGVYDFLGEVSQGVMTTPTGAIKMASILAGCDEEEMIGLFANRAAQVNQMLALVLAEASRRYGAKQEANGETPATPAGEAPPAPTPAGRDPGTLAGGGPPDPPFDQAPSS